MPHIFTDVVDDYLATWNEPDERVRAEQLRKVFDADAVLIDPLAEVAGHDAINSLITKAREQVAGMDFSRGTTLDGHHDVVRFTWHLTPPGEDEPVVIGFDVAKLNEAGRITAIYGFIDRMPQN